MEWLERTELLIGKEKLEALKNSKVLVAGLGGVGGFAAEMLCRAGIGQMVIIDADVVNPSNINRQILATTENIGNMKSEVAKERLLSINPELKLLVINEFIKDDRIIELMTEKYDFVVDAIDSLAPKIFLLYYALKNDQKIISSMGAGGKFDPEQIQIADFNKSYNDNLARMLRKRLHKLGVYTGFKVVFSPEKIDKNAVKFIEGEQNKKTTVGTISYMPAMFGGMMASYVIRKIINHQNEIEAGIPKEG